MDASPEREADMKRVVAILALALAACGSKDDDPPPPTELVATGPIALTAHEAIALAAEDASCPSGIQANLVIQATTAPGRCALVAAGEERGGARVITLDVVRFGGAVPVAIGTGMYSVEDAAPGPSGSTDYASAWVTLVDAACDPMLETTVHAESGSFVLTSVTPMVQGTVDLVLAGGGTLTGRFEAPRCATTADVCDSLIPLEPVCR
jgi:hypothetical protein